MWCAATRSMPSAIASACHTACTRSRNGVKEPRSPLGNGVDTRAVLVRKAGNWTRRKSPKMARWDGVHGVVTSLSDAVSFEKVRAFYNGLWRIERNFRRLKTTLFIHPMYHYWPGQVQAHVFICHAAITLLRLLAYRLEQQAASAISEEQVLKLLRRVQIQAWRDPISRWSYAGQTRLTPEV